MKLDHKFYQVPLQLPVEMEDLRKELSQFTQGEWLPYPGGGEHSLSIPLVSVGGTRNYDFPLAGAVTSTPWLDKCPCLQKVMASFQTPISRAFLLGLTSDSKIDLKGDYNYHWFRHNCTYLPIITNAKVKLISPERELSLAKSGEAWVGSNAVGESLVNGGQEECILLVIETKYSSNLEPSLPTSESGKINLEAYRFEVLTLGEIDQLTEQIFQELSASEIPKDKLASLSSHREQFCKQWSEVFERFGHDVSGELAYHDLILDFREAIVREASSWLPPSSQGAQALQVINTMVVMSSQANTKRVNKGLAVRKKRVVKPELHGDALYRVREEVESHSSFRRLTELQSEILQLFSQATTPEQVWSDLATEEKLSQGEFTKILGKLLDRELLQEHFTLPEYEQPIVIVSAPRAGSTLLFETLSKFPGVWTIGKESHDIIEAIPQLHPAAHNFESNRLTEAIATPEVCQALKRGFAGQLRNRDGLGYLNIPPQERPTKIRFLEKTPKNALRIPFFQAAFPGAKFIYIYRDARENISSMIEGWRARCFISYTDLPGWPFRDWSFLLTPGWSSFHNRPIAEIAAYQWKTANAFILDDLQALPSSSWCFITYRDLVDKPRETIQKISEFAELPWDEVVESRVSKSLPTSVVTLSAPSPDKWRKHGEAIERVLPSVTSVINSVEKLKEKQK